MQLLLRVALVAAPALACNSEQVHTLPRRYRFTRREGFSRVLRQQAKITNWFAIHWQEGNTGHARLGISVGKRAVPTAVGRNRVKRLIRECFRDIARQGMDRDLVIRLRKQIGYSDQQEAIRVLNCTLKSILMVAK